MRPWRADIAIATFAALWLTLPVAAQQGMDELLKQIEQGARASAELNAKREQRFLASKKEQATLLAKARAEKKKAEARSRAAKARFAKGQSDIATLKKKLDERVGDAGQMYAEIAQAAGEFRSELGTSLVSAEYPERLEFLARMASGEEIPSVSDLEKLWFNYAKEAAESGKVTRFDAEVVDALGERGLSEVVRVGSFNAVNQDGYLTFQSETGSLAVLPRQPPGHGNTAAEYFDAWSGWHPLLIDPSRGDLLRLMADRPTALDRVHQGGLVGYVIIFIGAVGALLAIYQFFYLTVVGGKVRRQLADVESPRENNPLGRVLASLKGDTTRDPEVLETRLSEAVLRETPKLERFQSSLRMIVAAGPLLGLLGTVIGMIITFQVITEVGSGDPKLMAAGISQAMVATVLGLMIAIPLLFVNTFLISRSRGITQVLDEQAAGLLAMRLEAGETADA